MVKKIFHLDLFPTSQRSFIKNTEKLSIPEELQLV